MITTKFIVALIGIIPVIGGPLLIATFVFGVSANSPNMVIASFASIGGFFLYTVLLWTKTDVLSSEIETQ